MAGDSNLLFGKFPGNFIKQKNIPVGCVPSAAVAVPGRGVSIGSVSDGRGVSAREVCLTGVSDRGVVCPGGVFSWRVGVCPGGGVSAREGVVCLDWRSGQGMSAQEVSAQRVGLSAQRGCLPRGCLPDSPCGQTHRHL